MILIFAAGVNTGTAIRAIRQTAMDDFSPIVFVKESNQQVVSFGRGPTAQLNKEAREWTL
jgi:hypothetical protein